jgi:hypothetical protein
MKASLTSCTAPAAHLIDKLSELANRQADLVDSFPRHYRLIPQASKRQMANHFDEFIVQLDSLVAKCESVVQKRKLHNRKAMLTLLGAIRQADKDVTAASEETSKLSELENLTDEFAKLRHTYQETLEILDDWVRQLDGDGKDVSLAA